MLIVLELLLVYCESEWKKLLVFMLCLLNRVNVYSWVFGVRLYCVLIVVCLEWVSGRL